MPASRCDCQHPCLAHGLGRSRCWGCCCCCACLAHGMSVGCCRRCWCAGCNRTASWPRLGGFLHRHSRSKGPTWASSEWTHSTASRSSSGGGNGRSSSSSSRGGSSSSLAHHSTYGPVHSSRPPWALHQAIVCKCCRCFAVVAGPTCQRMPCLLLARCRGHRRDGIVWWEKKSGKQGWCWSDLYDSPCVLERL